MKRIIAFVLALVLVICLSASAFATSSNQGGNKDTDPKSPQTGSVAIVALAVVACSAGAVSVVARKKSK